MRRSVLLLAATLGAGCGQVDSTMGTQDRQQVTAIAGFSWVIEGAIAGLPRPGTTRELATDLAYLDQEGVQLLVSLTPEPLDKAAFTTSGLELLRIPVEDFTAPTQAQLDTFIEAATAAPDLSVAVHCTAGKGRTGTFLATYLVARGEEPEGAIARVRELRPGSIETAAQEQAVQEFARRHGSGGPDPIGALRGD